MQVPCVGGVPCVVWLVPSSGGRGCDVLGASDSMESAPR